MQIVWLVLLLIKYSYGLMSWIQTCDRLETGLVFNNNALQVLSYPFLLYIPRGASATVSIVGNTRAHLPLCRRKHLATFSPLNEQEVHHWKMRLLFVLVTVPSLSDGELMYSVSIA